MRNRGTSDFGFLFVGFSHLASFVGGSFARLSSGIQSSREENGENNGRMHNAMHFLHKLDMITRSRYPRTTVS